MASLKCLMVLTLVTCLSACVNILPEPPIPSKKIVMTPKLELPKCVKPVDWHLTIERPFAADRLDSTRINIVRELDPRLIVTEDIADVEWEDRLTNMVQRHLIQSFEQSDMIRGVGRSNEHFSAKYTMETDIRSFGVRLSEQQASHAMVSMSIKIINSQTHEVIKQRVFTSEVDIEKINLGGFLKGIEEAYKMILQQIVTWTLRD